MSTSKSRWHFPCHISFIFCIHVNTPVTPSGPKAPWDRMDKFSWIWWPWRFYGATWRSSWQLLALSRRFHCVHRVVMALSLLVHGTLTALTAFCLHSEVVEITSRVLISQVRLCYPQVTMHQPSAFVQPCINRLPSSSHASTVCLRPAMHQPSAFVQPYLNSKLTTPWCPPPSSFAGPVYRQAIALLDGAQQ